MPRDVRAHLWQMLEIAKLIEGRAAEITEERLDSDIVLRSAVERWFTILGEAGVRVSQMDPEAHKRIPTLRRAIGFRNVLIHQYAGLDTAAIIEAVRVGLPALRAEIERLVDEP